MSIQQRLCLNLMLLIGLMLPLPALFLGTPTIPTSYAASSNQNMSINAQIPESCTVTGGGSITIELGTYDPVGGNTTSDATSTDSFEFRCTKGTVVELLIDYGSNASGTTRRMQGDSGDYLVYELYQDAGYTNTWGADSLSGLVFTAAESSPEPVAVHAMIPQGQDVSIGTYSDTLTMTISY